jgi:cell division GTPase FtsZ
VYPLECHHPKTRITIAASAIVILVLGLPPKAKTIWGARIDPNLKGSVSVTAVVTGVESAFLRKREKHFGPIKLW